MPGSYLANDSPLHHQSYTNDMDSCLPIAKHIAITRTPKLKMPRRQTELLDLSLPQDSWPKCRFTFGQMQARMALSHRFLKPSAMSSLSRLVSLSRLS